MVIVAAGVAVAALTADGPFWVPLVVALPFAGIQQSYDLRNRQRELLPELLGPMALAAFAPAMILGGGHRRRDRLRRLAHTGGAGDHVHSARARADPAHTGPPLFDAVAAPGWTRRAGRLGRGGHRRAGYRGSCPR